MYDEVAICNLALTWLGQKPITSLDDRPLGLVCKEVWPLARDAVLRLHRWNAIQRQAALARLDQAPLLGYQHAYKLPADCLRAWRVVDRATGEQAPFALFARDLHSDAEDPVLIYGAREEDTTRYDPLLVQACAANLAWTLAYQLLGHKAKAAEMTALLNSKLVLAKNIDGLEGEKDPPQEQVSSYVSRRWG